MLNQIILIGRTVRDVEVKTAPNGRPFAIVTMAVQRSFRNQQTNKYDTDFIDVSLWGSTAESVAKYAGKGSAISTSGRLTSKTIELDNGMAYDIIEIKNEEISFLALKEPKLQQQISPSHQKEIVAPDPWIPLENLENIETTPDDSFNRTTTITQNKESGLGL